jgi:hypothetical protein
MEKVHQIELRQYDLIQQIETKINKINVKIAKNSVIISLVTAVFVSGISIFMRNLF